MGSPWWGLTPIVFALRYLVSIVYYNVALSRSSLVLFEMGVTMCKWVWSVMEEHTWFNRDLKIAGGVVRKVLVTPIAVVKDIVTWHII